ncbi:MAG: hypothetical protein JW915_00170 [Chitinispirillaceae bacterium]|nr:hypothetical protein [Chitinispirillaceae bacterium]
MKKEINRSPLCISKLFVFLTILFASHVQALCTHSFNPLFFIQEHRIESVLQGPVQTFNPDVVIDIKDRTVSTGNVFSTKKNWSKEIITSKTWFSTQNYELIPLLPTNTLNTPHLLFSIHIRFIKHQSFSDDDLPISLLI